MHSLPANEADTLSRVGGWWVVAQEARRKAEEKELRVSVSQTTLCHKNNVKKTGPAITDAARIVSFTFVMPLIYDNGNRPLQVHCTHLSPSKSRNHIYLIYEHMFMYRVGLTRYLAMVHMCRPRILEPSHG